MATMEASALQGETVDALVWRILGMGAPIVEQVLELNRGIAAGVILAEGQSVTVPLVERDSAPPRDIIQLWD